ncbi:hypothetical protein [Algibacter sp. 2305UL17-15]|uniref:hypothetical protein n=1 Tax=Algibacter sp. 2305UL17-15 TaxID=3231268 RepID=UPI003459F0A3
MKTILKTTLLVFILTAFGCSTTNDSLDNEFLGNEKLFAKVNGESFVSGDDYIGASYRSTSSASALAIIATDVENLSFGKAIGITFSTADSEFELRSGLVFTSDDQDILLVGVYTFTGNDDDFQENTSMRLEITKVDTVNKLISGKFNFTAIYKNSSGNQKTYNVTDGEFNDVLYSDDS